MCILLYMTMCMLLSATSTHFKWELMLYCLHCPTLNKVFLLLLFLTLTPTTDELSAMILPNKVPLILEVWRYYQHLAGGRMCMLWAGWWNEWSLDYTGDERAPMGYIIMFLPMIVDGHISWQGCVLGSLIIQGVSGSLSVQRIIDTMPQSYWYVSYVGCW